MKPHLWVVLAGQEGDEVEGGESGLTAGGDKDEDRLARGVGLNVLKGWLVHAGHAGTIVLAGIAGYVHLQRHRPHRGTEVEQSRALTEKKHRRTVLSFLTR